MKAIVVRYLQNNIEIVERCCSTNEKKLQRFVNTILKRKNAKQIKVYMYLERSG